MGLANNGNRWYIIQRKFSTDYLYLFNPNRTGNGIDRATNQLVSCQRDSIQFRMPCAPEQNTPISHSGPTTFTIQLANLASAVGGDDRPASRSKSGSSRLGRRATSKGSRGRSRLVPHRSRRREPSLPTRLSPTRTKTDEAPDLGGALASRSHAGVPDYI